MRPGERAGQSVFSDILLLMENGFTHITFNLKNLKFKLLNVTRKTHI